MSDEESKNNYRPNCPYCNDQSGECEHVILDYDESFGEIKSGYIEDQYSEVLYPIEQQILKMISEEKKPKLEAGYLEDIWNYAFSNYNPKDNEIEIDMYSYIKLIDELIDNFGGESFIYDDEDGAPGYSSSYIIYYSKDPEKTIKSITTVLIQQLQNYK